jgi:serine/threonine protein phosphatase PrpC
MRRNIVPAVAGSLADVYSNTKDHLSPPAPASKTRIDEALRQALIQLDDDARTTTITDARPGVAWTARHASQATSPPLSTLLAFFDSESRMLHIANVGAGHAFLGRRVTSSHGASYECRELAGSSGARYFINPDALSRARDVDVEELVDGGGSVPSRSQLDVASVHVESIEVRDGDFLVLGSYDTWACLDGDGAVQAVGRWMREQEVASTQEQPARGERWRAQDRPFDFPRRDNQGLGFDWVHTMIPDLIRDIDKMFVDARGNAGARVLRPELKHSADGSGNNQDISPTPSSE